MLKVEHVTKYYGEHLAVKDLNFTVSNWRKKFAHKTNSIRTS